MSGTCLCPSSTKASFLLNSTIIRLKNACKYKNSVVANELTTEDYKAIGNCLAPVQKSYAIRLTYNPSIKCANNNAHPYFWGQNNGEMGCVNGQPLKLPTSFEENDRCHLAVIMPGSSNNVFTAKWTRCNKTHSYICQLQSDNAKVVLCNNATTSITTTTTTTTTTTASITNTSAPVIAGSVLGVLGFFFLLLLCYFLYNKNKMQTGSSKILHRDDLK